MVGWRLRPRSERGFRSSSKQIWRRGFRITAQHIHPNSWPACGLWRCMLWRQPSSMPCRSRWASPTPEGLVGACIHHPSHLPWMSCGWRKPPDSCATSVSIVGRGIMRSTEHALGPIWIVGTSVWDARRETMLPAGAGVHRKDLPHNQHNNQQRKRHHHHHAQSFLQRRRKRVV